MPTAVLMGMGCSRSAGSPSPTTASDEPSSRRRKTPDGRRVQGLCRGTRRVGEARQASPSTSAERSRRDAPTRTTARTTSATATDELDVGSDSLSSDSGSDDKAARPRRPPPRASRRTRASVGNTATASPPSPRTRGDLLGVGDALGGPLRRPASEESGEPRTPSPGPSRRPPGRAPPKDASVGRQATERGQGHRRRTDQGRHRHGRRSREGHELDDGVKAAEDTAQGRRTSRGTATATASASASENGRHPTARRRGRAERRRRAERAAPGRPVVPGRQLAATLKGADYQGIVEGEDGQRQDQEGPEVLTSDSIDIGDLHQIVTTGRPARRTTSRRPRAPRPPSATAR